MKPCLLETLCQPTYRAGVRWRNLVTGAVKHKNHGRIRRKMGGRYTSSVAVIPFQTMVESTTAPLPFAFGFVPRLPARQATGHQRPRSSFRRSSLFFRTSLPPSSLRMTGEKAQMRRGRESMRVHTRLPNELDFHILRSRAMFPYCRSCREWPIIELLGTLGVASYTRLRGLQRGTAVQCHPIIEVSSTVSNVNLTFEYEVVP